MLLATTLRQVPVKELNHTVYTNEKRRGRGSRDTAVGLAEEPLFSALADIDYPSKSPHFMVKGMELTHASSANLFR